MTTDPNYLPKHYTVSTLYGEEIHFKVGVLPPNIPVEPGFRAYYHGRLIPLKDKFLSLKGPADIPQMSRFIGEVHLNFVPVTTKKASFDTDSEEYKEAARRVALAVAQQGWIIRIQHLPLTRKSEIEDYERDLDKTAKKVIDTVLGKGGMITKGMVPGISEGIKPPVRGVEPRNTPTSTHKSPVERKGATAPTTVNTVANTVERWGGFHEVRSVSMGNDTIITEVTSDNGRYVLKINTDFPMYQAMKLAGRSELARHKEDIILYEICRIATEEDPKEFPALYSKHQYILGEYRRNQLVHRLDAEERRSSRAKKQSSQGTIYF